MKSGGEVKDWYTDVFGGEGLVSEGERFTIVTVLSEHNKGTELLSKSKEETSVVVKHEDISFVSSIEEDGRSCLFIKQREH